MSAHVRNAWPALEPKNRAPEGVEKEETEDAISTGWTDPNTENSRIGMEEMEAKSGEVEEGGREEPFRTNWTSSMAKATLAIEER